MAQTKRKRRTKHRGTAAGTIEARGRTGRKPRPEEIKRNAANPRDRARKPPTWTGALAKAGFGALMLFGLLQLGVLGNEADTGRSLAMAFFAMAFYVPIMYLTDRWTYQRWLKRQAQ